MRIIKQSSSSLLMYLYINLQVYKARRVAKMKMMDDGFDELVKERKKQKQKSLAEKGLLRNKKRKRKSKDMLS